MKKRSEIHQKTLTQACEMSTEKHFFSAHLGAETFMKNKVENPSKNTDSSMSKLVKNGHF